MASRTKLQACREAASAAAPGAKWLQLQLRPVPGVSSPLSAQSATSPARSPHSPRIGSPTLQQKRRKSRELGVILDCEFRLFQATPAPAPGSGPTPRISTSDSQKWLQFRLSRSYVHPCHSSWSPSIERRNCRARGAQCSSEGPQSTVSERETRSGKRGDPALTCAWLMEVTPSGIDSLNV